MIRSHWVYRLCLLAVAIVAVYAPANARVSVTVNQPNINPLPIAVTALQGQDGTDPQVGQTIADVVRISNHVAMGRVFIRAAFLWEGECGGVTRSDYSRRVGGARKPTKWCVARTSFP